MAHNQIYGRKFTNITFLQFICRPKIYIAYDFSQQISEIR